MSRLREISGIHWRGLFVPIDQARLPGVTYPGIRPSETFTDLDEDLVDESEDGGAQA